MRATSTGEVVTMTAPTKQELEAGMLAADPNEMGWLSREDIDKVIDSLSGADLIEGLADGANKTDAKISTVAFDTAAARIGVSNGTPASQHVRAADYRYLTKRVAEVIAADSPLPEGQKD